MDRHLAVALVGKVTVKSTSASISPLSPTIRSAGARMSGLEVVSGAGATSWWTVSIEVPMSRPAASARFSAGAPDTVLAEAGLELERAPEAPVRASAATTTATALRATRTGRRRVARGSSEIPRERQPRRNARSTRFQSCRMSFLFSTPVLREEERLFFARTAEAGIASTAAARDLPQSHLYTNHFNKETANLERISLPPTAS